MKEYINRLSLGKFRYDIPDIIKPDDVVRADVLCGTYSEEQLHIQASDVIKGVVYSSDTVSYTHLDVYKIQVVELKKFPLTIIMNNGILLMRKE